MLDPNSMVNELIKGIDDDKVDGTGPGPVEERVQPE